MFSRDCREDAGANAVQSSVSLSSSEMLDEAFERLQSRVLSRDKPLALKVLPDEVRTALLQAGSSQHDWSVLASPARQRRKGRVEREEPRQTEYGQVTQHSKTRADYP